MKSNASTLKVGEDQRVTTLKKSYMNYMRINYTDWWRRTVASCTHNTRYRTRWLSVRMHTYAVIMHTHAVIMHTTPMKNNSADYWYNVEHQKIIQDNGLLNTSYSSSEATQSYVKFRGHAIKARHWHDRIHSWMQTTLQTAATVYCRHHLAQLAVPLRESIAPSTTCGP